MTSRLHRKKRTFFMKNEVKPTRIVRKPFKTHCHFHGRKISNERIFKYLSPLCAFGTLDTDMSTVFSHQRNKRMESVELKFDYKIDLEKNDYLIAHQIEKTCVVSAASVFYLTINSIKSTAISFSNFTFLFPVTFEKDQRSIVLKYEICDAEAAKEVVIVNNGKKAAVGKMCRKTFHRISINIARITTHGMRFGKSQIYKLLSDCGYCYSNPFTVIKRSYVSATQGCAILEATEHLDVLIDGALQAIIHAYIVHSGKKLIYVPFHFGSLDVITNLDLQVRFIVVSFEFWSSNDYVIGHFTLSGPQLAVKASNVHFRRFISQHLEKQTLFINESCKVSGSSVSNSVLVPNNNVTSDTQLVVLAGACRLPSEITDLSEMWDVLKVGRDPSIKIPCKRIPGRDNLAAGKYGSKIENANFLKIDVSKFDAAFFGISKSEAEKMDPQQRILLECVYECMENAGLKDLRDVGMFVGHMGSEYADATTTEDDVISMLGASAFAVSGRLNYFFRSSGPGITVDTACSSSLVALSLAMNSLKQKECSMAIVAGTSLMLSERGIGQRCNGKMLSRDGHCRSFDSYANGYGRSDGCVAILIAPISLQPFASQNKIFIETCFVNHGGQSASFTAPNSKAQDQLIRKSLISLNAQDLTFWEAHGTGTTLGDAVELDVLGRNIASCVFGTAKATIGHTEAAAGVTSLLKVFLQMHHSYIPAHSHFTAPSVTNSTSLRLPIVGEDWNDLTAGVSSFGISGTNCVVTLRRESSHSVTTSCFSKFPVIYPLSAKTRWSLYHCLQVTSEFLKNTKHHLGVVCSEAGLKGNNLRERGVIFVQHPLKIMLMKAEVSRLALNLDIDITCSSLPSILPYSTAYPSFRKYFFKAFTMLETLGREQSITRIQECNNFIYLLALQLAMLLFLNKLRLNLNNIHFQKRASLIPVLLFLKYKYKQLTSSGNYEMANEELSAMLESQGARQRMINMMWTCNDDPDLVTSVRSINFIKLFSPNGRSKFERKLAGCYVHGTEINWKAFYQRPTVNVKLPNYSFQRKPFWSTKPNHFYENEFIGRPVRITKNEIVFENSITRINHYWMFECHYGGDYCIPFTFCLNVIMAACQWLLKRKDLSVTYKLSHFNFEKCCIKNDFWIQTTLKNLGCYRYRITISKDGKNFAASELSYCPREKPTGLSLKGNLQSSPDFYESLQKNGFCYGDYLKTISHCFPDIHCYKSISNPKYKYVCSFEAAWQVIYNTGTFRHLFTNVIKIPEIKISGVPSSVTYIRLKQNKVIIFNSSKRCCSVVKLFSENEAPSLQQTHFQCVDDKDCDRKYQKITSEKRKQDENKKRILDALQLAISDVMPKKITFDDATLMMSLNSLGFDSLMMTDLVNRLKKYYLPSFNMSIVDLFEHSNLIELADAINTSVSEREVKRENLNHSSTNAGKTNNEVIIKERKTPNASKSAECFSNSEISLIFREKKSSCKDNSMECIVTFYDELRSQGTPAIYSKRYQAFVALNNGKKHNLDWKSEQKMAQAFNKLINSKTLHYIRFNFSDGFPIDNLIIIFLNLARYLMERKIPVAFLNDGDENRSNAFAKGFARSFAAESHPQVSFQYGFHLKSAKLPMEKISESNLFSREHWLITGGLTGIGWQMAKWLLKRNKVQCLTLIGRRKLNQNLLPELYEMRKMANINIFQGDVSVRKDMEDVFMKMKPKLTGIIHSAGIRIDALLQKQTKEHFKEVLKAKYLGLLLIMEMVKKYGHEPQRLILNSSIAAILGNRGQCNYTAACALTDAFVKQLNSKGLSTTVVHWGNWIETGMAVSANEHLQNLGFEGLTNDEAERCFKLIIDAKIKKVTVAKINIKKLILKQPYLKSVFLAEKSEGSSADLNEKRKYLNEKRGRISAAPISYVDKFTNAAVSSRERYKFARIASKISKIVEQLCHMRIGHADWNTGLIQLGLDSLKLYRFVSELHKSFGDVAKINILFVFENPTIYQMAAAIYKFTKCISGDLSQAQIKSTCRNSGRLNRYGKLFVAMYTETDTLQDIDRLANQIETTSKHQRLFKNIMFQHEKRECFTVLGKSRQDLVSKIKNLKVGEKILEKPIICFVFPGQGSQIWNMGKQLSKAFPFFDRCYSTTLKMAQNFFSESSPKICEVLYDWNKKTFLSKTEYVQPILFCFCYSLAKLFNYFGVSPNYLVGHSVTELVAITLSGMIDLKDALKLVVERGKAIGYSAGKGGMLVTNSSAAKFLVQRTNVSVALKNNSKQVVLTGNYHQLKRCITIGRKRNYPLVMLEEQYPFHSALLSDNLDCLRLICSQVNYVQPKKPQVISNLDGELYKSITGECIIQQAISTIVFEKCIKTLKDLGVNIWLEIGPSETLSPLIRQEFAGAVAFSALKNTDSEEKSFLECLSRLQNLGCSIKWNRFFTKRTLQKPLTKREPINKKQRIIFPLKHEHLFRTKTLLPAAFFIHLFAKTSISLLHLSSFEEVIINDFQIYQPLSNLKNITLVIKHGKEMSLFRNLVQYCSCAAGTTVTNLSNTFQEHEFASERFEYLDHNEFYEHQRRYGLQYGLKLAALREICRTNTKVKAKIIQGSHPVMLIDAALQALSAILFDKGKPVIYLPTHVGCISVNYFSLSSKGNIVVYGEITKMESFRIRGSVCVKKGKKVLCFLKDVTAFAKDLVSHGNNLLTFTEEKVPTFRLKNQSQNSNVSNTIKNSRDASTQCLEEEEPHYQRASTEKVINILGYACLLNDSSKDSKKFWNNLLSTKNNISKSNMRSDGTRYIRRDIRKMDCIFFGISPAEAKFIDPQQRIMLELAYHAMEDAGLKKLPPETGVFIGVSSNDFAQKLYAETDFANHYLGAGTNSSAIAGRISYFFDLHGPSLVVDTACSSFGSALATACEFISQKRCKMALVGAVNIILNSRVTEVLKESKMLSPEGICKPFDADANGYVRSEGAGMILIGEDNQSNQSQSINHHASILAYGTIHNGKSGGITVPSRFHEEKLLLSLIEKHPSEKLGHVEMHAAGTALGDTIEMTAISNAVAYQNENAEVYFTSAKSTIGHCEAAAGFVSFLNALFSLKKKYIAPVPHFKVMGRNSCHQNFKIPCVGEEVTQQTAVAVNVYGFTGAGASFILSTTDTLKKQKDKTKLSKKRPYVIVVSARTMNSLDKAEKNLQRFLLQTKSSLNDVSAGLQLERSHYQFRAALVCKRYIRNASFIRYNKALPTLSLSYNIEKKPLSLLNVSILFENLKYFRKLFLHCINSLKKFFTFQSFQTLLKKSTFYKVLSKFVLILYLWSLGINPRFVFTRRKIDQLLAKFVSNMAVSTTLNTSEKMPMKISNTSHLLVPSEVVVIENLLDTSYMPLGEKKTDEKNEEINLPSLLFAMEGRRGKNIYERIAELLARLYVRGANINWKFFAEEISKQIELPPYNFDHNKCWPFDQQTAHKPCKTMQKDDEEASKKVFSKENSLVGKNLKNVYQSSFNHQNDVKKRFSGCYFQRYYCKRELEKPFHLSKFIAINFRKKEGFKNALYSIDIENELQFDIVKKFIMRSKCTNIVFNWEAKDNDAFIIQNCMCIIKLWEILVQTCHALNSVNGCFSVCVHRDEMLLKNVSTPNGCIALLRSLASEKSVIAYRYIECSDYENKIPVEVSTKESENECIIYIRNGRFVERIRKVYTPKVSVLLAPIFNTVLFTGGIRGINAKILFHLKPKHAIFVTKTKPLKSDVERLAIMARSKIEIIVGSCADTALMKCVFVKFSPIDLVFHCAALVKNNLANKMARTDFEEVFTAKVGGIRCLLSLCKEYRTKHLVAFSSVAAIFGSPGQSNYAVANSVMEQLLLQSKLGKCFSWGPWTDVGMLSGEKLKNIRRQIALNGYSFLDPDCVAESTVALLNESCKNFIFVADLAKLLKTQPHLTQLLECIEKPISKNPKCIKNIEETGFIKLLILNTVKQLTEIEINDEALGFANMGMDSLMTTKLQEHLSSFLNLDLPIAAFYENCTVKSLTYFITRELKKQYGANYQQVLQRKLLSGRQKKFNVCFTNSKIRKRRIISEARVAEVPRLFQLSKDPEPIVVVGYSGAFPNALDTYELWENLLLGESLRQNYAFKKAETGEFTNLIPRTDTFDYNFWNISKNDALLLDPQIRKFVEHAYFTLEKSGLVTEKKHRNIAVVAGAEPSECTIPEFGNNDLLERLYTKNQKDFIASWACKLLNLQGPSFNVYSACSTGLIAIMQCALLLRAHKCDVALAGAISLILPTDTEISHKPNGVFSTDGFCCAFDADAKGTVRGSMVSVVALMRLTDAVKQNKPIVAVLRGISANNDGKEKSSFMAPNVKGQYQCIQKAINLSEITNVEFVECHGTGTKIGDSIELAALSQAYKSDVLIGSIKANVGHGFAAGGITGFIKLCKIFEKKTIPKQVHFKKFIGHPKQSSLIIPLENQWISRNKFSLAISSFGIGGTNAHVIMNNIFPQCPKKEETVSHYLLPISGKTKNSCQKMCQQLYHYLESRCWLPNIAFTLQNHREAFEFRASIVAASIREFKEKLTQVQILFAEELTDENTAFFFAPQGVQYVGMGASFFQYGTTFRTSMKQCNQTVQRVTGVSLFEILFCGAKNYIMKEQYIQVALFCLCYAIAKQLADWGVRSRLMIGHSVGEYAAAAIAGVFSVEDGIKILFKRGEFCAQTKKASMIALKCYNGNLPEEIEVCAVLNEQLRCVVGPDKRIAEFCDILKKNNVDFVSMKTEHGFHSSYMDQILAPFRSFLHNFSFKKPNLSILSNIDGTKIKAFDVDYMVRHMRNPVRLDKCLDNLPSSVKVIVEIGPAGILNSLVKHRHPSIKVVQTVPSEKNSDMNGLYLLNALGSLWSYGMVIKWKKIFQQGTLDANLPTYNFDEHSFLPQLNNLETSFNEFRLFEPCWKDIKLGTTKKQFGPVLIFVPKKLNRGLYTLLQDMHNHFVDFFCIYPSDHEEKLEGTIHEVSINPFKEGCYEELSHFLRNINFNFTTIVHAWNFMKEETATSLKHNLYHSFYSIHWIYRHLISRNHNHKRLTLLALLHNNGPKESITVLGPLRELQNLYAKVKTVCVTISSELSLFNTVERFCSSQNRYEFSYCRQQKDGGYQLATYKTSSSFIKPSLIESGDTVLIFGSGTLATVFAEVLCNKFKNLVIVFASRKATLRFKEEDVKQLVIKWECQGNHKIFFYNVNLTNKEATVAIIAEVNKKHGLQVIIHAAGMTTGPSVHKAEGEMNAVIDTKVKGTLNIMEALTHNSVYLNSLILTSSLSSVLGIYGNDDYAAANIFLDEIARQQFTNIKICISVQWPGWKTKGMLANSIRILPNFLKNFFLQHALSQAQGRKLFEAVLNCHENVAICPSHPELIAEAVRKIQAEEITKVNIKEQPCAQQENDILQVVITTWKQCLAIEQIKPSDNFFKLGGNSLNGLQILWEIEKRTGIQCTYKDLFSNATLEKFYTWLATRSRKPSITILPNANKLKRLPLSYAQENMFLLRKIRPPTQYNLIFSMQLRGKICNRSLRLALLRLTARQISLREVFICNGAEIWQEALSLTEAYQNLQFQPTEASRIQSIINFEKCYEFDLTKVPIKIITLKNVDDSCREFYNVIVSHHHIISDGWSMKIFTRELSELYKYYKNGTTTYAVDYLRTSIADFAVWQRRSTDLKVLQENIERFFQKNNPKEITRLLKDKKYCVSEPIFKQYQFSLPYVLIKTVKNLSAEMNVTNYVVMLSAFNCLVRRFSDKFASDVVTIGSSVSGRPVSEVDSVIGYFLNNIIINVKNIKIHSSVKDVIKEIEKAVEYAREFEWIPYHMIVAKVRDERKFLENPLFDIYFNYRNQLDYPSVDIEGVESLVQQLTNNTAFNFSCTIDEIDDKWQITFDYNSSIYQGDKIEKMAWEYLQLLSEVYHKKSLVHEHISKPLNDSDLSMPLIDYIRRTSYAVPTCTAVTTGTKKLTYKELFDKATKFSHFLRQKFITMMCEFVRTDSVLPICLNAENTLLAILGIHLAGFAYLPVHQGFNSTLVSKIEEECQAPFTVTETFYTSHNNKPSSYKLRRCNLRQQADTHSMSYVIYTSGSTGQPKGVCIAHSSLSNFVINATPQMLARPQMTVYQCVSTTFDVSCANIFVSFANGSNVTTCENPLSAPSEISKYKTNFAFLPSALFNCFDQKELRKLSTLERIFVGGESPTDYQLESCLKLGIQTQQIYGPTEATIWTTTNRCRLHEKQCSKIIGSDVEPGSTIVISSDGEEILQETIGELGICGKGVARGYLNATSPKFQNNQRQSKEDRVLYRKSVIYRTGDLVLRKGGKYMYQCRLDSQVKICGYRVDTSEVERTIYSFGSAIKHVVVLKNEKTNNLIAFVKTTVETRKLFEFVYNQLPHYMVPHTIIPINQFPFNSSGKVDHKELLTRIPAKYHHNKVRNKIPTKTELQMMQLWQDVLSVTTQCSEEKLHLNLEDNFFFLGGNSLKIISLQSKIHDEFNIELNVTDIYQHPTLEDQCKLIDHISSENLKKKEILPLRRAGKTTRNLYVIHAIGGSIYPYYTLLPSIPDNFSVYAIEFNKELSVKTLKELAQHYAMRVNEHSDKPFDLMGHSLGGILAWEMFPFLKQYQGGTTKVVMIDSWCIGNENLVEDNVIQYIKNQMKNMPGKEIFIERAKLLTNMLRNHQFSSQDIPVYLLKAKNVALTPIKRTLREPLTELWQRSIWTNGWHLYCMKAVNVYLVNGDHESILHSDNGQTLKTLFAQILN